jgi:hypothetical protein
MSVIGFFYNILLNNSKLIIESIAFINNWKFILFLKHSELTLIK